MSIPMTSDVPWRVRSPREAIYMESRWPELRDSSEGQGEARQYSRP